jgi:hypothetical protein
VRCTQRDPSDAHDHNDPPGREVRDLARTQRNFKGAKHTVAVDDLAALGEGSLDANGTGLPWACPPQSNDGKGEVTSWVHSCLCAELILPQSLPQ